MKFASLILATLLPLAAQEIKLPPGLEKLAERATEVVDVTLDAPLLQLASRFLSDKDPDEARVKKLVSGLKGVYESDIEALRSQFRAPAWARIVGVRSRKSGDNADIFLKSDGGQVTGLMVIVAEPRELTIVSISGPINPDDIRDLGGHFGIPKLEVTRKSNPNKEE